MSGTLLANAAFPSFARHETFHPRFGWLRKAVSESSKSGDVLLTPRRQSSLVSARTWLPLSATGGSHSKSSSISPTLTVLDCH